jgi:hypothetical protein
VSPPKRKEPRLGGTGPKTDQIASRDYHNSAALQGLCQIQWRREAHRLAAEYRRTGNPAHFLAFKRHRAAMGGRARRRAAPK